MTESDQYIYAHEFLLLHLFLSIPVLAATFSGVWLSIRRLRRTRGLPPLGCLQLVSIPLGVSMGAFLLGIPLWALWPPVIDPMLAGFISGPTLAASLLLTVVLGAILFIVGSHDTHRRTRALPRHLSPPANPGMQRTRFARR